MLCCLKLMLKSSRSVAVVSFFTLLSTHMCYFSFSISLSVLWTICSKRKEGGDEAAHVLSVDLSIKTSLLPLVM